MNRFCDGEEEARQARTFRRILALIVLMMIVFIAGLQIGLKEGREDLIVNLYPAAHAQAVKSLEVMK